jgi:hypothetical protein
VPDLKTSLRQYRAAMVAEFALKQRFERIEWEQSVLLPELARIEKEAISANTIPQISVSNGNSYSESAS